MLCIFFDLLKGIQCVHHEVLLRQLETYGIRGVPHKWMTSYLKFRTQYKSMGYILKKGTNTPRYDLGDILFLLYVNDISSSMQNGHHLCKI